MNRDGAKELIVTGLKDNITTRVSEDARDVAPVSFIFRFKNNQFEVDRKDIPFYINQVRLPPQLSSPFGGTECRQDRHVRQVCV